MSDPVRVGVIDHGSGNLHSAERALRQAGAEVTVSNDPDALLDTDALVLPGVGALAACMAGLRVMGGHCLVHEWVDEGRPLLGICVGHQMLFERGCERDVDVECLGVLPGVVEELPAERLPHMGWNTVTPATGSALFHDGDERFYFVHSYGVVVSGPDDHFTTATHQGATFVAAAECGTVTSTQFHPEKSGEAGLALLQRWLHQLS
ncbi:imidazole glycerol phosphate synthase subunit HisH [Propionibacterium sp. NM47_B9-13]|uniref:Imidazole glycerol phosphate synthase subunit HisH n=2 Tax=Cutibacterium modestum TaxID=2559073 RepID=A0AAD1KQ94_9ACTN|nr:imidazole glycerol phosphate synthase subunit HisH [Cutibacterium modestum]TGY29287.1 imidazole glycerol phosphate synthase subunit HisH [Propionibacterium sp. NM47_B9-13]AOH44934.1 imidazole glycerol phosphate synthase, glutamine amidotransferase subunit [Cutibacterium modestum]MCP2376211.1 imidazole glycerol phosphate synthase subunit HisH [Cutibacterium modestum 28N]REB74768.1 imidazole glycerol phosphate synthase subunit HisH [Cutibacterium modestum]BCY25139.1 imidazole glycerol phospha